MLTETDARTLAHRLAALSVFRGMLDKRPLALLLRFLRSVDSFERMEALGAFVYSLAEDDYSLADFLIRAVCEDENLWVQCAAQGKEPPSAVLVNGRAELALFSGLSRLTREDFASLLPEESFIPAFDNHPVNFEAMYSDRLAHVHQVGYGVFATAGMFRVTEDDIVPVEAPDSVSLNSFIGYDAQRQKLLDNTRALVEGRPAANALLCGDAGTGKSSTVKACANHFFDQGVRLIELRKDQLFSLGWVMGRIARNPLKFIIFIDDLSFNKNDDSFSMLKAALEGSASARAGNAVIYATSNRRHIVKETFSDRTSSDDVHRTDTMQELLSLSDRFGLTIYFEKPNKQLYLSIVHDLAQRYHLDVPQEQLDIKAEAFALGRGSRSPRAAEQFVRSLI